MAYSPLLNKEGKFSFEKCKIVEKTISYSVIVPKQVPSEAWE
jgi:hypothetical protein